MKEVQLFLRGYFYAAWQERNHASDVDGKLNQMHIITKNAGRIVFAINRGICHVDGNTAHAFKEPEKSLFDIVENWTTPEIWDFLKKHDTVCEDEARIDFNQLCWLIYSFGGLDLENM